MVHACGLVASRPAVRYLKERLVKFQCTTRLAESAVYSIIMIFMGNTPCGGNYQSKKFLDQLDKLCIGQVLSDRRLVLRLVVWLVDKQKGY